MNKKGSGAKRYVNFIENICNPQFDIVMEGEELWPK
jgi:hypothetical protein